MTEVSISDGEWEVMNVIWNGQSLTSQEVVETLSQEQDWSPTTIKTMLHRLVKKKVLTYETRGNKYVYRAAVRRTNCVRHASRSFLSRVFEGESSSLVTHFLKNAQLTPEEIDDLRRILDEQEAQL